MTLKSARFLAKAKANPTSEAEAVREAWKPHSATRQREQN